ncbi:hypothetical protein KDL30_15995 [bacterium]|nr:hypothetical protein [bacterium]
MRIMNYKILATLALGALLLAGSCNNGPDPAEQMAQQYSGRSQSSPPADAGSEASAAPEGEAAVAGAEDGAEANPCEGAEAEANPCGEAAAENPCGEAAEENPCAAEEAAENPCSEAAEENPCAADEAAEENPCAAEEAAEENPCAADEAAEENPCAEAAADEEGMDKSAPIEEEAVEETEELDPVDAFMELDPRDILRAKQKDLEGRLTSPWDDENPDEFIPETGRVDPLTFVDSAIPDQLKPPRSGSTDENEILVYLATLQATRTVEQVAAALQCHSVIQIGVVSTAYFSLGLAEDAPRFSMQEGGSRGINGAQVSCSEVTDSRVTVTISVPIPGNVISRTKIYIPRSVGG